MSEMNSETKPKINPETELETKPETDLEAKLQADSELQDTKTDITSGNNTIKTVGSIMIITLFGKLLGLLRDQFFAWNYGTGVKADAFLTASRIPRVFFDAVFASAISASFIPVFNEVMTREGKNRAFELANNFLNIAMFFTAVLTVLGIIFSTQLTRLFADGFSAETAELCSKLLSVMFPIMLITAVAFIFVGILQSLDEFRIPAAISIISNLVIILYYVFFNSRFGVFGLAIAFLCGWGAQVLVQIPPLVKRGYRYRAGMNFSDEPTRKIFKMMLPVMISTWIQPINIIIITKYASRIWESGGVSSIEFANNLYTIIVGVLVLAVANVIFPKLSRMAGENKMSEFSDTVDKNFYGMCIFIIPLTVGLFVMAKPIISFLFEYGYFDGSSTERTASALMFLSLGMMGYGIHTIASRAYYAMQKTRLPLISGIISIGMNIVLCAVLSGYMEIAGVALASSVSQSIAALVLIIPLCRNLRIKVERGRVVSIVKMCIAALIMGVCVYFMRNLLSESFGSSVLQKLLMLLIPTIAGVLVYALLCLAMRVPGLKAVTAVLSRRLKRG